MFFYSLNPSTNKSLYTISFLALFTALYYYIFKTTDDECQNIRKEKKEIKLNIHNKK